MVDLCCLSGLGGGTEEAPGSGSKPAQPGAVSSMFANMSFGGDSAGAAYTASEDGQLSMNRGTYQGSGSAASGGTGNALSGLSGPVSGGPGAYNGGSSAMTGMGNPNFKDPREELSFMQRFTAMADTASEKLSSLTSSSSASATSKPSTFTPGGSTAYPDYNMASNRGQSGGPAVGAWGQPLPSSTPSPAAAAFASNTAAKSNTTPLGGFTPPGDDTPVPGAGGMVPDIPSQGIGMGRAGSAASDGQYEQQMVASLCEAGGMKAVPPEDALQAFLSAAPTLSPEMVGASLLDCLNSDSWQSRVKALLVIAALATGRGCGGHSAWWKENGADDVQAAAQGDSKASVRTQAIKTLRALGLSVTTGSTSSPARQITRPSGAGGVSVGASGASTVGGNVSLIDFDDDAPPTAPTAAAPASTTSILDMLSEPPSSLPASTTATTSSDGGLFDGLSIGTEEVPTRTRRPSVPAPVAAKDPSLQASVFNFLDSMDPYSNASGEAPSTAHDEEEAASGFSFMAASNGGAEQGKSVPVGGSPMDLSAFEGMSTAPAPPAPSAYDLSGLNMTMPYPPRGPPMSRPPQHHTQSQQQQYPPPGHGYGQGYGQGQGQYVPYHQPAMGSASPQMGVRKVIPDAGTGWCSDVMEWCVD